MSNKVMDVYQIPPVLNASHQLVREVLAVRSFRVDHVTMPAGAASPRHCYTQRTEMYFVLDGKGILYHGATATEMTEGAHIVLPASVSRKLQNTGNSTLEHIVISTLTSDVEKIEVVDISDQRDMPTPSKFKHNGPAITALEGAIMYDLLQEDEARLLNLSVAKGFLPPQGRTFSHYHRKGEEIYYILSGSGIARIGDTFHPIKRGSILHLPPAAVHGLQNRKSKQQLRILCLSSPPYSDGDFVFA